MAIEQVSPRASYNINQGWGIYNATVTGILVEHAAAGTHGVVTATTVNALTLTAAATGFTVAGGTSSKTLTLDANLTASYLADITSAEADQIEAIGATTISAAQWGYLGACGAGGGQLLAALTTGESDQLELIGATTISAAQWGYLGGSSGIDHYVDRGDPGGYDKSLEDFTTDGTWRDLDLSAIVPVGAVAVLLIGNIQDDVVNSVFCFRKNGNTYVFTAPVATTLVVDTNIYYSFVVACDSNRVIEYMGSNLTFTGINLTVGGWWV